MRTLIRRERAAISRQGLELTGRAGVAPLRRALDQCAALEAVHEDAEVSVLIAGDRTVQRLNKQYRLIDRSTDVLSFAQDDPLLLGDIVISADTAARQAQAAGWPLTSEMALLATHGLLHLLGHDDDSADGAAIMEQCTRSCLVRAGIILPAGTHPFFQLGAREKTFAE